MIEPPKITAAAEIPSTAPSPFQIDLDPTLDAAFDVDAALLVVAVAEAALSVAWTSD